MNEVRVGWRGAVRPPRVWKSLALIFGAMAVLQTVRLSEAEENARKERSEAEDRWRAACKTVGICKEAAESCEDDPKDCEACDVPQGLCPLMP